MRNQRHEAEGNVAAMDRLLPGVEEVLIAVRTLSAVCVSPRRQLQNCTAVPPSRARFLRETCVFSPQTRGQPAAMPPQPWSYVAQVRITLKMQADVATRSRISLHSIFLLPGHCWQSPSEDQCKPMHSANIQTRTAL